MKVRVAVAVLLALLVGAGVGYAVADSQEEPEAGPTAPRSADVTPVPSSPRLPVAEITKDRDDPTLQTGIALVQETLEVPGVAPAGPGDPGVPTYDLTLPTPQGWGRRDGTAKWTYTPDGTATYPYGLRVQVIADQGVSMATALRSRTSALESAEAQGNLADLQFEVDPTGDGFEASYIDSEGYRIVSLEQFYSGDDPNAAFATIAAYGRVRDRDGLVDLLALVSKDLRTSETPVGPS